MPGPQPIEMELLPLADDQRGSAALATAARSNTPSRPRARYGEDLWSGFKAWRLWMTLGWSDIRGRYRRSVLGPWWITLSTAIFTTLLGVIYSQIFHTPIGTYLPYVALGLIAWGFISGATMEGCNAFAESAAIIKQIKMPASVFVLRVVWRNFLFLLHTIVLIVPIAILFPIEVNFSSLLVLPGLFLLLVNQVWICLVLAILATRFRDVQQIIGTALQVMIFATPIMWPIDQLGPKAWIAHVNPVYHFIELIRAPLLGGQPPLMTWVVAVGMVPLGYAFAMLLFARAARRLVYWL
jgi:ABC-type polysaccharide/polyol phosphate export permease